MLGSQPLVLIYKVVSFFCLKLKISITIELDRFLLGKIHIGPLMVLDYLIFRFSSWDGFRLFFHRVSPSFIQKKTFLK